MRTDPPPSGHLLVPKPPSQSGVGRGKTRGHPPFEGDWDDNSIGRRPDKTNFLGARVSSRPMSRGDGGAGVGDVEAPSALRQHHAGGMAGCSALIHRRSTRSLM